MKQTSKITICSICSALASVVMLVSYFPYFTYAVPAVAGLFVMIPLFESGYVFAFYTYLVSGFLTFLFAEPESKVLYVCLFGFYPILKGVIEKLKKGVFEWIIKIILFNFCVFVAYLISKFIVGISFDDLGEFGKYGAVIFLLLCNVAFVLYDIAISRVAAFYFVKIRPKIRKYLK